MKSNHVLFVYGTLRPGTGQTALIPGVLYDLGWYPGVELKPVDFGSTVVVERIEVDDERLAQLDQYEGYRASDPKHSLFLRVPVTTLGGENGQMYVYNDNLSERHAVSSGDWLDYTKTDNGRNSHLTGA